MEIPMVIKSLVVMPTMYALLWIQIFSQTQTLFSTIFMTKFFIFCWLTSNLPFPLVLDSVPFPKPNYKVPITPTPTSNLHLLPHLRCSKPPTHFTGAHHKLLRKYSFESNESVEELDCNKEVVMINHKFVEAREEIEIAMESKETEFWWESGVHSGCCEGSVTCLKGYWPSC